ncbi:replication factor A protein 3 [Tothia fuscella]|uniref:Replication factor A protein 3 n=1 Tax=Tothia fuscella TaxID=1048955 RepID=A0A9P4NQ53_9PEZI|nr:replication factor A protein 3 [Tothia fuscella]
MSESTPRISSQYLENFQHQTVRVVGKITQLRGESATMDANGSITLQLNRDTHLQLNHACEVIGKVQGDLSIRVLTSTDFGTEFDLTAADAVVDATHRYKEIFYGDGH